jgi:hypothetical protein
MKTLLPLIWFVLATPLAWAGGMISGVETTAGRDTFDFFPKNQIRMEAAFDWEFHSFDEQAKGFDVAIYCRWTNVGKSEVKLLLKDHDAYHGTLDYPWGIQVRITGKNGKVITENTVEKDGWWDGSNIQSQLSKIMPGDAVVLKPGETVVRLIPLQSVLANLGDLPGLSGQQPSPGDYFLKLRLGGILAAKPLTLHLGGDTQSPHL